LIFEISSLKNPAPGTGFFVYFELIFYCLGSLQKSSSKKIKNPVRQTRFFELDISKIMWRWIVGLDEITAFRLESIFKPMRALEFITGHMVYNTAYNQILQTKETKMAIIRGIEFFQQKETFGLYL
jgi:hypothetical protein